METLKQRLLACITVASILILGALISGCASFFTAKTEAEYITPDGKTIRYSSDKEQVGLDVKYVVDEHGRVKEIHIKVDKAGTQEAVIAAALQQQTQLNKLLEALLPLVKAAAMRGM